MYVIKVIFQWGLGVGFYLYIAEKYKKEIAMPKIPTQSPLIF
jgi:hypothetical protein